MRAGLSAHPVFAYFAVTFAISWGGVLAAIGYGGIPDTPAHFGAVLPFAIAGMLAGPAVAGLLLTWILYGPRGLRELVSRLVRPRVGALWYAVALLTAPIVMTAIVLGLSLISPAFLPGIVTAGDKLSLLVFGLTAGLGAGVLEELGWTGFATPGLRPRHRALATGLIVGVLWGAWHIPATVVLASGTYGGTVSLLPFLILRSAGLLAGALPAFRVLMVWVYERTGSLLVSMLMHVSLTASLLTLNPLGIAGTRLQVFSFALAAALWLVVAAVSSARHAAASGWLHGAWRT